MLIEFRLRNYRCFKDEQVLSMVASSDSEHPENVVDLGIPGVPKLLRSAVVYGANGSGKTTLLEALNFVHTFVSNMTMPGYKFYLPTFLFDEKTAKSPTDFEVIFVQDKVRYQYGFTADETRIYKEWLYASPNGREAKLFVRQWAGDKKEYDYDWGDLLKGEKKRISNVRENALFLTQAAFYNHPQLLNVYQWFSPGLEGWPTNEIPMDHIAEILQKPQNQEQLVLMLKNADMSIESFSLKQESASDNQDERKIKRSAIFDEKKKITLTMRHKIDNGKTVDLNFLLDESKGTQRFFGIGAVITEVLKERQVLYVDEIDSSLHPLLSRAIIQLFHNPQENCRNVQLIFNTHDTTLLDPELFRRDQIWFTEKKKDGSAELYSLAEFSPRKGEALAKNYLQGRYGAIPFVGNLADEWSLKGC
ncbi:MAG: ATP-binding protein [Anaerolineales bacterium]